MHFTGWNKLTVKVNIHKVEILTSKKIMSFIFHNFVEKVYFNQRYFTMKKK